MIGFGYVIFRFVMFALSLLWVLMWIVPMTLEKLIFDTSYLARFSEWGYDWLHSWIEDDK